jgi:putative MATE family efflux protein
MTALTVAALMAGGLALLGYLLMEPIFSALGAQPRLLPDIRAYMTTWFAGAVLLVIPMVCNAVLRAAGDTRTPSLIMASGGLLNAIFDPLLIFGIGPFPELGIQGAAVASVISWVIGSLLVLWYLRRKQLLSLQAPEGASWLRSARAILKIGLPAASANMLTPIAMAVLTAIVATYGAPAVAAFGVGTRLESLALVVVLALSMALPPLLSQNFGAAYYQRMQQAYHTAIKVVMLVQALIYLLLVVSADYIAMAFTTDPEVARLIRLFIYIMPLSYGLQGVIILTNSSFNALHQPLSALMLSIIRLFVMFVPLSYLGAVIADMAGLFVGGVVANIITAGLAWWWFKRTLQRQQEST